MKIANKPITLKQLGQSDATALYALVAQSRAGLKNLVWSQSATLESTRAFLVAKSASTDTVHGIYLGEVLAGVLELRSLSGSWELGYWLGMEFRGQGIMPLAVTKLVAQVASTKPVTAHIRPGNMASRAVLECAGLRESHREMWREEEWVHFSTSAPTNFAQPDSSLRR